MNPMPDMKIELFASSPTDNTAEVEFLRELIAGLSSNGCEALVVCQPKLTRCTPDYLVVTERGAWTVDVKTVGGSLHGTRRDSKWRIKIAGAKPKQYPNLLTKMKQHREALLDDMRAAAKVIGVPVHRIQSHVGAVAAVWPKLPEGSDCEREPEQVGGYLVADGQESINMIVKGSLEADWPLALWRRFIQEHLRAVPVGTIEELCDALLFEAVRCGEAYREEFVLRFGAQRDTFAPHQPFSADLEAMVSADGAVLVHGASGLGKTSHLEACAIKLAGVGALPVFASAEIYEGSLDHLLAIAAAGYAPAGSTDLLSCLPRLTAQRRVLFVDGVDSVAEEPRRTLLSQVADQWERGMWNLVVLSAKMEAPDVDGRLPLRRLKAPSMEGEHREAVYRVHHRRPVRTPWQERLLEVAADGFAVRALALAGDAIPDGASLAEAIASYVRSLLPHDHSLVAAEVARGAALAMESRFAQSLTVSEFDRIASEVCRKEGVGLSIGDLVRQSRLFRRQGDRIRFQHEQLQVFVAAQAFAETASDASVAMALLKQPRNRGYLRFLVGLPKHRSLTFLVDAWSTFHDETLIDALLAGEFGAELRAGGLAAVCDFLNRYCAHIEVHGHAIVFAEPAAPGGRPQPILAEEREYFPSQPVDGFALRLLRSADVFAELSERIADALFMEEESLLRAAQRHAVDRRGSLQLVRKLIAVDGIPARESTLLLRMFHRDWRHRADRRMAAAIAGMPTRGGTIAEIIALQAKLGGPMDADQAASALTRWTMLMGLSGFKAGRVFERYFDHMLPNWDSLIEAHAKDKVFGKLLEDLVNEGLSTNMLFDDTLVRFAMEIGIIEAESLETQTSRFLEALRAKSDSALELGEDEPASSSPAKRHLFDRAVELNEWDAWVAAWGQLSAREKRAFAREVIPSGGAQHSGFLESMLVGFLADDACIQPEDLVGVFHSLPWKTVFFGIGDVAACHMDLAARWGGEGKDVPEDAFSDPAYADGDAAAWPIWISLIHAVARSSAGDAKAALDLLVTDHPLVLPGLLAAMMERRSDGRPLRTAAETMLKDFRLELATASAHAACNLDRLRSLLHPADFDKARTVSLIFQLCVDGNAETLSAVQRHTDSLAYGGMAIAAIRARADQGA